MSVKATYTCIYMHIFMNKIHIFIHDYKNMVNISVYVFELLSCVRLFGTT